MSHATESERRREAVEASLRVPPRPGACICDGFEGLSCEVAGTECSLAQDGLPFWREPLPAEADPSLRVDREPEDYLPAWVWPLLFGLTGGALLGAVAKAVFG